MPFFDLATIAALPWKNGGGSTRELACWPPAAGMEQFAWRISVARIAAPGPFSAFPGVDRQIMLLSGGGVQLRAANGRWEHALDTRWQPFAFSGDDPVECRLLAGTSTDLNLMLRRGVWSGTLQLLRTAAPPARAAAGLGLVLQGAWRCSTGTGDTRVLTAGQGLWWMDGRADGTERLEPLDAPGDTQDAGAAPALAWIALERRTARETGMQNPP
ncbi:HutD family protein [Verminephrobacter aporrectodeae subsp. tuberculatae]|uniref:HutD/Ves family protein n=1 Tax=Verminephrobacter aporrectodeae TaxID=1110389 RepID=UPI0022372E1D|nr:HutD family protein [Verminephrobacter aporrectodeae]MCW5220891.1 HutD family protein [Verminephrobacter aporrectodeae subsp. tuberculatae]MCW5290186.1 HutD family protein [Verminephrobacter aporrectodeae subsp. tuberculatae]